MVVNGNACDLVIANDGVNFSHIIFPKTKNGWKIGIASKTKTICTYVDEAFVIEMYKHVDSNEYFIAVYSLYEKELIISDVNETEFAYIEVKNTARKTYYAHINNFSEDYIIYVNGSGVPLWKQFVRSN